MKLTQYILTVLVIVQAVVLAVKVKALHEARNAPKARTPDPVYIIEVVPPTTTDETAITVDEFLDALRANETGGEPNGGRGCETIDANGMKFVGPLQVGRACWIDSRVPGRWEDCHDFDYAKRVAIAYWKRHCPDAYRQGNIEVLSRVWRGGPHGHRKAWTTRYWSRLAARLVQGRSG